MNAISYTKILKSWIENICTLQDIKNATATWHINSEKEIGLGTAGRIIIDINNDIEGLHIIMFNGITLHVISSRI